MALLVLVGSALTLALALRLLRRSGPRGRLQVLFAGLLGGVASIGLACGGFLFWLAHRGQPAPVQERWFQGVQYERLVLTSPRPVVAHLVRIDLRAKGIEVVVSAAAPSSAGEVRALTTSAFAAAQHVQLAVNASYFYPFRSNHPFDYEPHVGQPVHVLGLTASRGTVYGNLREGLATAYFSPRGELTFRPPAGPPWNAVSGMGYVVQEGAPAVFTPDEFTRLPYPRSLLSVDASGRFLSLLIVDGKQPGYSEGLTLGEAAHLLIEHGAHTAIQLDGGGSATLVRQSSGGSERINIPSNFRIPGWERAVATQLGFRARAL